MQLMQPMAIAEVGCRPQVSVATRTRPKTSHWSSGGTDVLKDSGWRQSHLSGWLEHCMACVLLLVVRAVLFFSSRQTSGKSFRMPATRPS